MNSKQRRDWLRKTPEAPSHVQRHAGISMHVGYGPEARDNLCEEIDRDTAREAAEEIVDELAETYAETARDNNTSFLTESLDRDALAVILSVAYRRWVQGG